MCSSIISATSISFMACSTHCSGAGSLVIFVLLGLASVFVNSCMFGQRELARRVVVLSILRAGGFGAGDDAEYFVDDGDLRQPWGVLKWTADARTRVVPFRQFAARVAPGFVARRSLLWPPLTRH